MFALKIMLQQIKTLLGVSGEKKPKDVTVTKMANGPAGGLQCGGASASRGELTDAEKAELAIRIIPRDSVLDHANTTPNVVAAALARARLDNGGSLLSKDDSGKVDRKSVV